MPCDASNPVSHQGSAIAAVGFRKARAAEAGLGFVVVMNKWGARFFNHVSKQRNAPVAAAAIRLTSAHTAVSSSVISFLPKQRRGESDLASLISESGPRVVDARQSGVGTSGLTHDPPCGVRGAEKPRGGLTGAIAICDITIAISN